MQSPCPVGWVVVQEQIDAAGIRALAQHFQLMASPHRVQQYQSGTVCNGAASSRLVLLTQLPAHLHHGMACVVSHQCDTLEDQHLRADGQELERLPHGASFYISALSGPLSPLLPPRHPSIATGLVMT